MGLLLMFFISFCFCVSSSSPVGRAVLSDSHLENDFGLAGSYDHNSNRITGDHDQSERSGIMHSSKFAHGAGSAGARGGGGSGTQTANGNSESNGAGAETVPSTASSTSNDNRHPNTRHNAASSLRNSIMFPTLILVVFASIIVHLYA